MLSLFVLLDDLVANAALRRISVALDCVLDGETPRYDLFTIRTLHIFIHLIFVFFSISWVFLNLTQFRLIPNLTNTSTLRIRLYTPHKNIHNHNITNLQILLKTVAVWGLSISAGWLAASKSLILSRSTYEVYWKFEIKNSFSSVSVCTLVDKYLISFFCVSMN